MSTHSMKWLAGIAAVLLLAVIIVKSDGDKQPAAAALFLPSLKAQLNEVTRVQVAQADELATIARNENGWVVANRSGYRAATSKLRNALLELAEARKLEAKTANPERLAQLGLDTVDNAVTVHISGADLELSIILGNVAQQSNRYVRMAEENQAWLIDRNPEFAAAAGEWLATDLMDLPSDSIDSVTITHSDSKDAAGIRIDAGDDGQFIVQDIPEGRELRYASIANSLATALQGLTLEDVRPVPGELPSPDTRAVITTNDGLTVNVTRFAGEGGAWFSFDVTASDEESATDRAAIIRNRVEGWQYRLPSYKAEQLAKRRDDLLKPESEE